MHYIEDCKKNALTKNKKQTNKKKKNMKVKITS